MAPSKRDYRWLRTVPGKVDKQDITELLRQLQEMIYQLEGRRGPISSKDGLAIDAEGRHTPLSFRGTGQRGAGSIGFSGSQNASMNVAKGAHLDDNGNWVADDTTAVIMELNRESATPLMYRNEGLIVGNRFQPIPVGYVAATTSPSGPGGFTPPGGGGGGTSTPVDEIGPRRALPHTHLPEDVMGIAGAAAFALLPRVPHTHNYADLVGSQLLLPDGNPTTGKPALAFANDSTTGIWRNTANGGLVLGQGGNFTFGVKGGDAVHILQDASIIWTSLVGGSNSSGDLFLRRDAADTLAQRRGASPQTFRVYKIFTDGGNYEFFSISSATGSYVLQGVQAGSGSSRDVFYSNSGSGQVYYGSSGTGPNYFGSWAGGGGNGYLLNAGTAKIVFNATDFTSWADMDMALGTASKRWRAGYFGGTAAAVPITVKLNAAQTANALEVQNSSGTPLTVITKDADILFQNANHGLMYGSCWGNDIAWTQASAVQNTWYPVSDTDMTDGQLNGVTHDGSGKLTVTNAGRYLVNYGAAVESSVLNEHIETGISVSGTVANDGRNHFHVGTPNVEVPVSCTAILSLAASATIEFAVRTPDAGTPNITVQHLNISVVQVGG